MKTQVQDLGKLRRELLIEIPFDEIKPIYNQTQQKIRNTKLRGFRPWKISERLATKTI